MASEPRAQTDMNRWPSALASLAGNHWIRLIALTVYYLAILVGLIALYGRGDFSTPPFVYQNF